LNRKSKILLASAFILMMIGTAVATLYFIRQVGNQCAINAYWDIKLIRGDTGEVLNTIAWGNLDPGEYRSTNQLYGGLCTRIRNDGNSLTYVAWQLDPASTLPSGVSVGCKYESSPGSFVTWNQLSFSEVMVNPAEISVRIDIAIYTSPTTPPGTFTFTLNFHAADSGTG